MLFGKAHMEEPERVWWSGERFISIEYEKLREYKTEQRQKT